MELIRIENLTKKYSGNPVLSGISFSVEKGDFLCILGENGSGKTTLMRLILGLIEPSSGTVWYAPKIKNKIGYLPQQASVKADFPASVKEVLMSGFLNSTAFLPVFRAHHTEKCNKMLERLHLVDFASQPFSQLSGGQRQRVLLGRAILASNGILLLDEPLNSLDPMASADFFHIIEEIKAEGFTVIMITHDIHCAIKYGTKILHLAEDETYLGTPEEYAKSHLGHRMLSEGHHHV